MHFSIEQTFLTDSSGKPLGDRPAAAYHIVDADTLDAALSLFLGEQQASLVGTIQRLPGAYVVATAQQQGTVFTLHVAAGSDSFQRERRPGAAESASGGMETPRDAERPR
jgi:hypothetical protein